MKADYPVLVSLAERYDLEYQDDILNCLQVTHFILFARQFYQAESNTAALSDFYFITSKHIGFKPVQITEPLTQDQVRLSYMALRDNIDPIKYKDKLRKRIFININLSKDLPTPTKPSQSSPQQVPSKKYPITIESSVSLEELQLYDDEALKKQIQREQFPRNNYSVLRLSLDQISSHFTGPKHIFSNPVTSNLRLKLIPAFPDRAPTRHSCPFRIIKTAKFG